MKTKRRKAGSVVEMSKTGRSPRPVVVRIEEASRPALEVIACTANCAGIPHTGVRFIFDLRDNRTGRVYTSLRAKRIYGEWDISGLWPEEPPEVDDGLPVLRALVGKHNFVDGEENEYWDRFKIVSEELNRWNYNLFARVEEEMEFDDGLDECKEQNAAIQTLYLPQGAMTLDGVTHEQYWKWPLRP